MGAKYLVIKEKIKKFKKKLKLMEIRVYQLDPCYSLHKLLGYLKPKIY